MKIILKVKNFVSNAILIDFGENFGENIFIFGYSSKVPLGSLLVPWSGVSIILGQKNPYFFFEHLNYEIRCKSLKKFVCI
jgi:hypothetical protein